MVRGEAWNTLKDDVKKSETLKEVVLMIENYNDIKVDDVIRSLHYGKN